MPKKGGHHCSTAMLIVTNSKGQRTRPRTLSKEENKLQAIKAPICGPGYEKCGHEVCMLWTSALPSLSLGNTALRLNSGEPG